VLKLGNETPASAPQSPAPQPSQTPEPETTPSNEPPVDDKPFNDQKFDAGVQADEESDPKKFIQQLTGKLGQSLRKYNDKNGTPDFELEKFVLNSTISATHSGDMSEADREDIVKKLEDSGKGDGGQPADGGEQSNEPKQSDNADDSGELDLGVDDGLSENDESFIVKPKKLSIFAPEESDEAKSVNITEEFNKDMNQPITKPKTKPDVKPATKPTRRELPFRPTVTPQKSPAKAQVKEGKGKSDFKIYHTSYGSALNEAKRVAEEKGYVIEDDAWFNQVTTSYKPKDGQTAKFHVTLYKGGIEQKVSLNFQVYNSGITYELNVYIQ